MGIECLVSSCEFLQCLLYCLEKGTEIKVPSYLRFHLCLMSYLEE